jgi:HAD superfamily hydrolase (TIGR01509 family)
MSAPINPRAILVDLDGTLADSIGVMRTAYREFLSHYGTAGSDEEFDRLNGPSLSEIVRLLKIAHSLSAEESVLHNFYAQIVDRVYGSVSTRAGAYELLREAQSHRCRVCVVTSNSAGRTRRWLDSSGLLKFVDNLVAGEDVQNGKPHPEPYLLASRLTAIAIGDAIAVEDSSQGAQSAVAAGLRTIVVTPTPLNDAWPRGVLAVESLHELAAQLW